MEGVELLSAYHTLQMLEKDMKRARFSALAKMTFRQTNLPLELTYDPMTRGHSINGSIVYNMLKTFMNVLCLNGTLFFSCLSAAIFKKLINLLASFSG